MLGESDVERDELGGGGLEGAIGRGERFGRCYIFFIREEGTCRGIIITVRGERRGLSLFTSKYNNHLLFCIPGVCHCLHQQIDNSVEIQPLQLLPILYIRVCNCLHQQIDNSVKIQPLITILYIRGMSLLVSE